MAHTRQYQQFQDHKATSTDTIIRDVINDVLGDKEGKLDYTGLYLLMRQINNALSIFPRIVNVEVVPCASCKQPAYLFFTLDEEMGSDEIQAFSQTVQRLNAGTEHRCATEV